ncbi:exported hypothetical protein [Desulfamplus magnetovallimortis]|uniref:NHL repeat containing protein n=1 Tax=Desulfamplus magnetovallimortis TaxID=1246637 RepID=A0A1W1HAP1_9BACT|nr:C13 family peptidase [Desulfamplus magnetovallimortis]SLM29561.1 exported hypothetical protein [Desulfamplus magnetovallimortis]
MIKNNNNMSFINSLLYKSFLYLCSKLANLFSLLCLLISLIFLLAPLTLASQENSLTHIRSWPQISDSWCLNTPMDIAVDYDGNIYVLDTGNYRIQKFTPNRNFITSWGSLGSGNNQFVDPKSIAFHPEGYIYVSDNGYNESAGQVNRIQKFTLSGKWIKSLSEWKEGNTPLEEEDPPFNTPVAVTTDKDGYLYVAVIRVNDGENKNNRIYKFNAEDNFIKSWEILEDDTWSDSKIIDVAVEPDGNILVLVDTGDNYPVVQRFSSEGALLEQSAINGLQEKFFNKGFDGICVDKNNNIYISEICGYYINIFSKNSEIIKRFGGNGIGEGQFNQVHGITLDQEGNLYVADSDNQRIQKLTSQGDFIFSIGCSGNENGLFNNPEKILIGHDERVYVADSNNERIQIYEKNGLPVAEIPTENYVVSMAVDDDGYVYTIHEWEKIIKKYTADGIYITQWDSVGGFSFTKPVDIDFGPDNYLYVADKGDLAGGKTGRIFKITTDGDLVKQWNNSGYYMGEFTEIFGLKVTDGSVYVIDYAWYEPVIKDCPEVLENPDATCGEELATVQKFDLNGNYQLHWGSRGIQNGFFINPTDVAVDPQGFVWVVDSGNSRIQKFDSNGNWIASYGERGTTPGSFSGIKGIAFDSDGLLYTTESGTSRVQVFSTEGEPDDPGDDPDDDPGTDPDDNPQNDAQGKNIAIIVAGGGPYQGNTLWDATQMCANMAYRTLIYQGYTKEMIQYLSWDTGLDLDGNSLADDVDGEPSTTNLKSTLETWAKGAKSLVVFMIDHGGDEQFRLGELELMSASDFAGWFTTAHSSISGNTILIYDACRSGSFLPSLAYSGENPPIIITSSKDDQNAYFTNNGTLSFSYQFWSAIGNGMNLMDAFLSTRNAIQFTYTSQSPLIDDNGNGIANEDYEGLAAREISIGKGTISAGDFPAIQSISFMPQNLEGETSSTLYANNVIDADGILRVWAVISPPDLLSGNPDNPVTELPSVELLPIGGNSFQGTYKGFTAKGKYKIAVYAEDKLGNISLPLTTSQGIIQNQGDASAVASSDAFHIRLPCVKIGDQCMEAMFELDVSKSSGLFYILDFQSLDDVLCSSVCAELLPDLNISVPRLIFNDIPLSFIFRYKNDQSQFVWELDLTSVKIIP